MYGSGTVNLIGNGIENGKKRRIISTEKLKNRVLIPIFFIEALLLINAQFKPAIYKVVRQIFRKIFIFIESPPFFINYSFFCQ
jgi:hypothetical protein